MMTHQYTLAFRGSNAPSRGPCRPEFMVFISRIIWLVLVCPSSLNRFIYCLRERALGGLRGLVPS